MSQLRPNHPILIFFTSGLLLLCITLIASQHTYTPLGTTAATNSDLGTIRKLLSEQHQEVGDDDDDDAVPITTSIKSPKKKPTIPSFPKNQTKSNFLKPKLKPEPSSPFPSSKNLTKAFSSSKNSTKPIKLKLAGLGGKNSSKLAKVGGDDVGLTKVELKKLNSTATKLAKKLNSTGKASDLAKPGKDFLKKTADLAAAKKPTLEKAAKKAQGKESKGLEGEKKSEGSSKVEKKADPAKKKVPKKETPSLLDLYGNGVEDTGDEDDLITQFRDLPAEFHRSLLPDLEKISAASKAYVGKANERIAKNFRPYVGRRYASAAAAMASFAFVLVPLIIVSLVVRHMKEHLSVQRMAVFVHVYLAVYFSILCGSALLTGVEPLRFFDATAHSTYAFLQIVQMVGYTLYLMLLFLYLVRVFTTGSSPGTKLLVLAQAAVGYAIGIHYYVMVFHRAVSHQPPKTSWKAHGVYAACFVVVCFLARAAEHRKKAYLEGSGEDDKQS